MTEKELIQKQIEELQSKLEELEKPECPIKEAYKKIYGHYPVIDENDYYRWGGPTWFPFKRGYTAAKKDKESEYQPSMVNCILKGTPPDGYVTWNEWYNELGSKGILHNLKISSKEVEVNEWKDVALKFGEKLPVILPYGYYELSPAAWFRWVVFTYDKYMEERDKESGYTPELQEEVNKLQEKEWLHKMLNDEEYPRIGTYLTTGHML